MELKQLLACLALLVMARGSLAACPCHPPSTEQLLCDDDIVVWVRLQKYVPESGDVDAHYDAVFKAMYILKRRVDVPALGVRTQLFITDPDCIDTTLRPGGLYIVAGFIEMHGNIHTLRLHGCSSSIQLWYRELADALQNLPCF